VTPETRQRTAERAAAGPRLTGRAASAGRLWSTRSSTSAAPPLCETFLTVEQTTPRPTPSRSCGLARVRGHLGLPPGAGIGKEHTELAVVDLAGRVRVLALHPTEVVPFFKSRCWPTLPFVRARSCLGRWTPGTPPAVHAPQPYQRSLYAMQPLHRTFRAKVLHSMLTPQSGTDPDLTAIRSSPRVPAHPQVRSDASITYSSTALAGRASPTNGLSTTLAPELGAPYCICFPKYGSLNYEAWRERHPAAVLTAVP
jgi:hypothetical protein